MLSTAFLGCRNSGEKQAVSKEKKVLVIAKEAFQRSKTNMDGSISSQWPSIEHIEKLATINDDPIKRLIAFRALLSKYPHEAVNLAISHIEDTTIVSTTDGVCGEEDRVSNVRICMLHDNERYHVSEEDLVRLDSAMLFSANISKFGYSYWLYQYIPAKTEYEDRLRQIYEQDPWALVTLAKYKREKDKQKIKKGKVANAKQAVTDAENELNKLGVKYDDAKLAVDTARSKVAPLEATANAKQAAAQHADDVFKDAQQALADAKQKKRDDFGYLVLNFHNAYEDNPRPLFKQLIEKYPLEK